MNVLSVYFLVRRFMYMCIFR